YSVKCMSNLRSIGQIMMMYANDNRQQIPTGVMFNRQDWGYWAFTAQGRPGPWGVLILSGLVTDGRYLYCPEQPPEQSFVYNGESNPWPTDLTNITTALRVGYDLRPDRLWNDAAPGYPIRGFTPGGSGPVPLQRIDRLKGKAIAADFIRLQPRHGRTDIRTGPNRGINNVLYADGHVQPVPYSIVYPSLSTSTPTWLRPTEYNWSSGQWGTVPEYGAWADLDKEGR
ncbi:MAG TPA: hypothetical protein PKB10_12055, partial [Tepidisphaeraceae bacterium]|nr:hypothetical protein [Tepidisphaeraceae bacterium]